MKSQAKMLESALLKRVAKIMRKLIFVTSTVYAFAEKGSGGRCRPRRQKMKSLGGGGKNNSK